MTFFFLASMKYSSTIRTNKQTKTLGPISLENDGVKWQKHTRKTCSCSSLYILLVQYAFLLFLFLRLFCFYSFYYINFIRMPLIAKPCFEKYKLPYIVVHRKIIKVLPFFSECIRIWQQNYEAHHTTYIRNNERCSWKIVQQFS